MLKAFNDRLIAAGKPGQVALTAVMRKRIVLMNHLLKNPEFTLAPETPLLGFAPESRWNWPKIRPKDVGKTQRLAGRWKSIPPETAKNLRNRDKQFSEK